MSTQEYTLLQKLMAACCGRQCDDCGKYDTEIDPARPDHTRLWASFVPDLTAPPGTIIKLEKEGSTCWWCFRVHNVCYAVAYPLLSDWKKEVVKDFVKSSYSLQAMAIAKQT